MAANSKNALVPVLVLSQQSLAGSFTGPVTTITFLDNISLQLIWSGAPVGSFTLESCLDYKEGGLGQPPLNPGTWQTLPIAAKAAGGAPGSELYDLTQISPCFIRVRYTSVGGAGTVDQWISGKAI